MAFPFGNIYGFSSWFNQARGPLSYLCLPARQTPILYDLHSDRTVNGVLDLLLCDFRVNEPLNRCLALSLEDSLAAFADLAKSTANNRVSVVAMHGGRVVGCRLSTIIQTFAIEFDAYAASYRPGDTVKGRVVFNLKRQMVVSALVLQAHGEVTTGFVRGSYRDQRYYDSRHVCMLCDTKLMPEEKNSETAILRAGLNEIPFRFTLPLDCPRSFTTHSCHIRYCATAGLFRPWRSKRITEACFYVRPDVDIGRMPYREQTIQTVTSQMFYSWLSAGNRPIWAALRADSSCFLVGECPQIQVLIRNESNCNVKAVSVRFITQIVSIGECREWPFKGHRSYQLKQINGPYQTVKSQVHPNDEAQIDINNLCIPFSMVTTMKTSAVEVLHYLRLQVQANGLHSKMYLSLPIAVGNTNSSSPRRKLAASDRESFKLLGRSMN